MKIAFDAQPLLNRKKSGIGWCATNIVRNFINLEENEYLLNYYAKGCDDAILNSYVKHDKSKIIIQKCNKEYNKVRIKSILHPITYSHDFPQEADITQFFNYVIPHGVKGKAVTMVHDMAYKACPDTVSDKTRVWLELAMKRSMKRADKIITVSEFSKSEIVKYLNIDEEKIVVMPNGVDFDLYHDSYSLRSIDEVLNRYHINRKYFLYVGTIEPRKNLIQLIHAFEQFPYAKDYQLVLAGGIGWKSKKIRETIDLSHLKDNILLTDYVPEEDIPLLMNGCEAFVFPSIYEGFGMPVAEAMACRKPVITSNISSMPEIIGEAGIYVDPYNSESIVEAFNLVANQEEKCSKLAEIGYLKSKQFTWKNSVEILLDTYRGIL